MNFDTIDKQRLDILAGVRTDTTRSQQAVRRDDLAGLISLAPQTSSRITSGTTVSVAKYNALVDDVAALWQAISQITARIK